MSYSETGVYPGKPLQGQGNIASASSTSVPIVTAHAQHAAIVKGPLLLCQKGTLSRAMRVEIKNGGTTTIIGRIPATGTTQYALFNLMSNTYIPGIEDEMAIRLNPGEILQITPEDTVAAAHDCTALNAWSYEYPN